jgi:hypothetical protein
MPQYHFFFCYRIFNFFSFLSFFLSFSFPLFFSFHFYIPFSFHFLFSFPFPSLFLSPFPSLLFPFTLLSLSFPLSLAFFLYFLFPFLFPFPSHVYGCVCVPFPLSATRGFHNSKYCRYQMVKWYEWKPFFTHPYKKSIYENDTFCIRLSYVFIDSV